MIQNKIFTPRNIKLLKKTSPAFSTIPQSPFQAGQKSSNFTTADPTNKFKDMRIFRNHTSGSLFNLLSCNKMVQKEWLVKNSEKLYLKSASILGGGLVNTVIEKTVGKVYTGGNTLKNIPQIYKNLQEKNVNLIINYCDEAPLSERCEADMDKSTQFFIASIRNAQEVNSNIGVKYSGICCMDTMKFLNVEKRRINQIFTDLNPSRSLSTMISGQQIFNKLNEMGVSINEQEFIQFSQEILKKSGITRVNDVKVTRVQWESLVHPYYIEKYQNENPVMKKLIKFSPLEATKIENIVRRLTSIYNVAAEKPSSRIYVDAEQSFVQYFIESISTQYQIKYNHSEPMVYSTIQCYLKDAHDKLYVELEKQKEFGIKLGLKFVKGAYLSEEKRLADADNLQESYESTGKCYVDVAKIALDNLNTENEILFGIHNVQNVEQIEEYMQEQNIDKNKVDFAQLLGMADFITYSLADKGYRTSKYVPFGETDIMIPYLCRRAYEGFKFMTTSKLQEVLIKDEIKKRFFFKK